VLKAYLNSSVGRKQIVAVTGLGLVLFLVAHLAGNLLIYKGPEAFNGYAAKLQSLGALLWVARFGMIAIFVTHIVMTVMLVIENRKARGKNYAKDTHGGSRSLATRLMPYTGSILLFYIISHLLDFTLADHHTVLSMIDGVDLGLYGLVVNSFKSSLGEVIWYCVAMFSVGFHLAHGIQSTFRSFGYYHTTFTPLITKLSTALAVLIAVGFSSIPLYIYVAF
jgi:succinate dehydrogenase / fumarate reductase, cytochrome b subunit